MPMRLYRPYRDQLFNAMTPYLDQMIYSYNARGIFLPNDADEVSGSWQRFFNRQWYDDTYFSKDGRAYKRIKEELDPHPEIRKQYAKKYFNIDL